MRRMSTVSTQPPATPATRPTSPPMSTPEETIKATGEQAGPQPEDHPGEDVQADLVGPQDVDTVERGDEGLARRHGRAVAGRCTGARMATSMNSKKATIATRSPIESRLTGASPPQSGTAPPGRGGT